MTATGSPRRAAVFFALEAALAAGCVFGICQGLVILAARIAARPVGPDASGEIVLLPEKAELRGTVSAYPRVLEEQEADFSYHFGRELYYERRSRRIGRWRGLDGEASWQIELARGGRYEVFLEYGCSDRDAGGTYEITLGTSSLSGRVESTGGAESWQERLAGSADVAAAGVAVLRIRATSIPGDTLFDLVSVRLEPATAAGGD